MRRQLGEWSSGVDTECERLEGRELGENQIGRVYVVTVDSRDSNLPTGSMFGADILRASLRVISQLLFALLTITHDSPSDYPATSLLVRGFLSEIRS
jgi:hypothetical protein